MSDNLHGVRLGLHPAQGPASSRGQKWPREEQKASSLLRDAKGVYIQYAKLNLL